MTSSRKRKGILDALRTRKAGTEALTASSLSSLSGDIDALDASLSAEIQATRGAVSTANASTTPLSGAAAYTGTWEDVSAYRSLIVGVRADVKGTYQLQFSPDGTNADSIISRNYRAGTVDYLPNEFMCLRKWFRVVFTNGASAQSFFRLQVLLRP